MAGKSKKQPILHGNQAKIDPNKKVVGRNITNQVTMSGAMDQKSGAVKDLMIEDAREFSQENQQ